MREIMFLVMLAVLSGLAFVTINVVRALTGTQRNKKSRFQTKNLVLAPIRKRFGAENLRASRIGEFNVYRPALVFDYGRTMAKLKHFGSTIRRRQTRRTVLETDFLSLPHAKYIRVVSRSDEIQAPESNHLETGDEEFDREFFVYTNDPVLAKQLLTDAVKWKMTEIKNMQQSEVRFELQKGELSTTSSQWFGSGAELLDFVQGGLELFDQLMLHNEDGVEFLKGNQAAVMEDFRCPICSDEVMQDMVVCKRCKTPHCAECWEYNGKCATFACMEERCIRVQEEEV